MPAPSPAEALLATMWHAVSGAGVEAGRVTFTGERVAPAAFSVSDFAAAAVATAGLALAALVDSAGGGARPLAVDRELASGWFATSIEPIGWELPPSWDPLAAAYEASDGWVRLHTNAPHHRAAALRVLGCEARREAVASAVGCWRADDLEAAVVTAGGCAAAMRETAAWRAHPQGRAVASEPLVAFSATDAGRDVPAMVPERPLAGVRVLDLTRILAGPVATRLLAGYGAEVLRIDPPGWQEATVPEVTLGKRCATLDARSEAGRARLEGLLSEADVLVHGYRPGALDRLGLGAKKRRRLRPGLVEVALDAYGFSGPWRGRRGFDSLVQMSSGIAAAGAAWQRSDRPHPLPFQALDHATGYLLAAAALHGLRQRRESGCGSTARCSLARTAQLLLDEAAGPADAPPIDFAALACADEVEQTSWGPARRLAPPLVLDEVPLHWTAPAVALGTSPPAFSRWP